MENPYNPIEFRSIVLHHIEEILKISAHELRDQTIQMTHENHTQTIQHEDTRFSYIQSIENLAYVLLPYFDDQIKDTYKKCIKVMTAFPPEVKILLRKRYDYLAEQFGQENTDKVFAISMKLKYAKRLFCELNLLLHRVDYLKSAVYGEDKSEVVEAEEIEGVVEE